MPLVSQLCQEPVMYSALPANGESMCEPQRDSPQNSSTEQMPQKLSNIHYQKGFTGVDSSLCLLWNGSDL